LNSTLLLVKTDRRQIRRIVEGLSELDEITEDVVQDVGKTLATELGQIIEAKLVVSQIKLRLENLRWTRNSPMGDRIVSWLMRSQIGITDKDMQRHFWHSKSQGMFETFG
jgi:hypothetical protein